MPLINGSTAEVMRSGQKDAELASSHLHPLVNMTMDSITKLCKVFNHGDGSYMQTWDWMQWASEIELLTNILYFTVTTITGQQTIGEEYVNIIQVGRSRKHHPTIITRTSLVALHCLSPYLFRRLAVRLRAYVNSNPWMAESRKPIVNDLLQQTERASVWIYKLHRSLFFLGISKENIAKLLTSVGYVSIRQRQAPQYKWFKIIGYLGLFQAALALYRGLNSVRGRVLEIKMRENITAEQPLDHRSERSQSRCPLCYEPYNKITTTPCGHMFCWSCVYPWICAKSCCPVCRDLCEPRMLVLLVNFEL